MKDFNTSYIVFPIDITSTDIDFSIYILDKNDIIYSFLIHFNKNLLF